MTIKITINYLYFRSTCCSAHDFPFFAPRRGPRISNCRNNISFRYWRLNKSPILVFVLTQVKYYAKTYTKFFIYRSLNSFRHFGPHTFLLFRSGGGKINESFGERLLSLRNIVQVLQKAFLPWTQQRKTYNFDGRYSCNSRAFNSSIYLFFC